VCTDGQNRASGKRACADHGGVDSVSTLAAVKSRAQARRFGEYRDSANERTSSQGATAAGGERDTAIAQSRRAGKDSTKWCYPVNRDPEVQNPAGYRGMERPIETFPPDSMRDDSTASASATSRVNQMKRQDSLKSGAQQNPPGYRGMERPAALDSTTARTSTGKDTSSVADTTSSMARDTTGMRGNDSTTPSLNRENQ
jgi:hypothetical protein